MARRAPTGARALRLPPLDYQLGEVDGLTLLAREPVGAGRIVEVLGDLAHADAVAVVVPGNAHQLSGYLIEAGGAAPRVNGRRLLATLRTRCPGRRCAVVVWLGYRTPRGFVAGARPGAAAVGADELARLTHHLPAGARLTLIGHSYGSVVCAAAVTAGARANDLVALASPGLGVRHARELSARVWAARSRDDWVRLLPRGRLGGFGHGRQPADPGFGATVFATDGASGHSGYYAPGSASLANIARIVAGRHGEVTLAR